MDIVISESLTLEQTKTALRNLLKIAETAYNREDFNRMVRDVSPSETVTTKAPPFRCEGCSQGDYCPDPECPG